MANYSIKMLKDEQGTPFVPLVSTQAVRNPNGQTVEDILSAKLSPENIVAGDNIIITQDGDDVVIAADVPEGGVLIDNLSTTTAGQGALDARQGNVLLNAIPEIEDSLSTQSSSKALSANQGYVLNNKIIDIDDRVINTEEILNKVENSEKTIQKNNSILLPDASEGSTVEYKIDGKIEQELCNSINFYNYRDTTSVGSDITIDEDGWITIRCDNTGGSSTRYFNYFTNNMDLQTSTEYSIFLEVKDVSGDGSLALVNNDTGNGQFDNSGAVSYSFESLESGEVYKKISITKSSFNDDQKGLRSYGFFNIGKKGLITFRISVLADTSITTSSFSYEPYTGGHVGPSPEFNQEIKSLAPRINLLDNKWDTATISGVTLTKNDDGTYNIHGTNTSGSEILFTYFVPFDALGLENGKIYTYSSNKMFTGNGISRVEVYNDNTWVRTFLTSISASKKFSTGVLDTSNANKVRVSIGVSANGTVNVDNIGFQLEEGSEPTDFIPYGRYYLPINIKGKNLFDYKWFYDNCVVHNCSKELIKNGIKISFTAGADAYVGEARKISNGTTIPLQNIAIPVKPNTVYTLSASSFPNCYLTYMDKAYGVINSDYISIPSSYTKSFYNFTTPNNARFIGLRFGISNNSYSSWSFSNIQLEEGVESTIYEDYKENNMKIDVTKPSVFNISQWEANKNSLEAANGSVDIVNSNLILSNPTALDQFTKTFHMSTAPTDAQISLVQQFGIEILPDMPYTFTFESDNKAQAYIFFYDSDYKYVGINSSYVSNNSKHFVTGTAPSNAKYLSVRIDNESYGLTNSTLTVSNMKIYQSLNPRPYYELCSDREMKDYLIIDKEGNTVIIKNIDEVQFQGNEGWNVSGATVPTGVTPFYSGFVSSRFKESEEVAIGCCNYFRLVSVPTWGTPSGHGTCLYSSNQLYLKINSSIASTLNEIKAWVNEHHIDLYMPLKQSYSIELDNIKIPLFEGVNHISFINDLDTNIGLIYYAQNTFDDIYYNKQQVDDRLTNRLEKYVLSSGDELTGALTGPAFRIQKNWSQGSGITNSDGISIIRDYGNQNVTVDATGGVLFLGYQNTTEMDFLNGKASLNANGIFTSSNIASMGTWTAIQAINGTNWKRLQINQNGTVACYTSSDSGSTWTEEKLVKASEMYFQKNETWELKEWYSGGHITGGSKVILATIPLPKRQGQTTGATITGGKISVRSVDGAYLEDGLTLPNAKVSIKYYRDGNLTIGIESSTAYNVTNNTPVGITFDNVFFTFS